MVASGHPATRGQHGANVMSYPWVLQGGKHRQVFNTLDARVRNRKYPVQKQGSSHHSADTVYTTPQAASVSGSEM